MHYQSCLGKVLNGETCPGSWSVSTGREKKSESEREKKKREKEKSRRS
jgi:hypothetical protein